MKKRLYFSFFGLLFGGLLLVRLILAVLAGLADGGAVLGRFLDIPSLLGCFVSSLAVAGLWYYLALRR